MALIKKVDPNNTGIPFEYMKIHNLIYEYENDTWQVELGVYYNQEFRDAGRSAQFRFTADVKDGDLSGEGSVRAQVYNSLKELPQFEGAIDA